MSPYPFCKLLCFLQYMPVKCIWCTYLIIYGRSDLNCLFFLLFMIYLTLHRAKDLFRVIFKKCWLKLIFFVLDLKILHFVFREIKKSYFATTLLPAQVQFKIFTYLGFLPLCFKFCSSFFPSEDNISLCKRPRIQWTSSHSLWCIKILHCSLKSFFAKCFLGVLENKNAILTIKTNIYF
jgi:hypothetical protein